MGPDGNDNPAHPVILTKGFYLGKYEVTQEQYEMVIGDNPSKNLKEGVQPNSRLKVLIGIDSFSSAFYQALSKKELSVA